MNKVTAMFIFWTIVNHNTPVNGQYKVIMVNNTCGSSCDSLTYVKLVHSTLIYSFHITLQSIRIINGWFFKWSLKIIILNKQIHNQIVTRTYFPATLFGWISWTNIPNSPSYSLFNPTTLNPRLPPSGFNNCK